MVDVAMFAVDLYAFLHDVSTSAGPMYAHDIYRGKGKYVDNNAMQCRYIKIGLCPIPKERATSMHLRRSR
jgi:hypothetical protein